MGITYKQKTVSLDRDGQPIKTVVIANRQTDVLHPGASTYLLNKSLSGAQIRSVKKYASVILGLIEEIDFDPELESFDDLTDQDMSNYLELVLINDRGNSASTINQSIDVISDYFTFLHDQGFTEKPDRFTYYLSDSAELKLAKQRARQNSHDPFHLSERYIPINQFELLLTFEKSLNAFVRDRNEIILRLGYETGMRAHEITSFENLSVTEFEAAIFKSKQNGLNEVEIKILGKRRKLRTIVIEPPLRRKIETFVGRYKTIIADQIICSREGQELGELYASTIFLRAKKNLIRLADVQDSDRWERNTKWTFHATRHGYATNLALQIESGERPLGETYLMDRLGHSHLSTTIIYLHFAAAQLGNFQSRDDYLTRIARNNFNYDKEEFSNDRAL